MTIGLQLQPSLAPFDRPFCPECAGPMFLVELEPGAPGSEFRTYECPIANSPTDRWCDADLGVETTTDSSPAGWSEASDRRRLDRRGRLPKGAK